VSDSTTLGTWRAASCEEVVSLLATSIEVLLDHADGSDWVFRRSAAIRRPLSGIMRRTGDGVPYLAPEIPLCTALRAMTPDHVWLTACEG